MYAKNKMVISSMVEYSITATNDVGRNINHINKSRHSLKRQTSSL